MKIEGSGYISQRHGSVDPDPHKISWIRNTGLNFDVLYAAYCILTSVALCCGMYVQKKSKGYVQLCFGPHQNNADPAPDVFRIKSKKSYR
jgi:hypothetical protein